MGAFRAPITSSSGDRGPPPPLKASLANLSAGVELKKRSAAYNGKAEMERLGRTRSRGVRVQSVQATLTVYSDSRPSRSSVRRLP